MPDGSDNPAPSLMNTAALGPLLVQRRTENKLSVRQAAADAGVSFSTFSRVEGGAQPDLATFLRLCSWLGIAPAAFFPTTAQRQTSGLEGAITHLAADPRLSPEAATQITAALRQMYEVLAIHVGPTSTPALALHLRASQALRPGVPDRLASILTDMHDRLTELVDAGDI